MTVIDCGPQAWAIHGPGERLDYLFDWSSELDEGDTVSGSSWVSDPGLDIDTPSFADDSTGLWITAVAAAGTLKAVNTVATSGGRILVRTLHLIIEEQ